MNSNGLTSKHGASSWGPSSLLVNAVLLYVVLAWLVRFTGDPFDRTLVLALGNLVLSSVLLFSLTRNGALLPSRTTTAALLGWSVAYCLIYGAFVRWPKLIPVWGLVAAQACAPFVAVLLSGDHQRETASLKRRLVLSFPVIFLLAVPFSEWRSSARGVFAPYIAVALVLLFAFSQSCARIVARTAPSAAWAPPRLALLNGTGLLLFWAMAGTGGVHSGLSHLLRGAAILSIGIFAVQAFYLFGLAKTAPFLSAVLLSTSVPIAIFGDSLLKAGPSHGPLALVLSVCFSAATGAVAWVTSERRIPKLATPLRLEAD